MSVRCDETTQYMPKAWDDCMRVLGIFITVDIYHFFVLGTFKIPSTALGFLIAGYNYLVVL